ncbi:nuclear transport factor 2 family protein [Mycobacterium simiae]|uniref:nuclear transport factor 2 family protein n=1 Tax=Mycobacterium simiae TaxID=1784 RepID=UPI0026203997|nr:nuclear transport factor 2 family protein [Mycobacterium simiae]
MEPELVVKAFYANLARGAAQEAISLLHPQLRWTEAERTPYYTGELTSVDAVVATVLEPIMRDFDDFAVHATEYVAQGDRIAAAGRYTGRHRRSGGILDAPFVHLWTVRDGAIVRFVQHTDSASWNDAIDGSCRSS